jgi:hypothetical protein
MNVRKGGRRHAVVRGRAQRAGQKGWRCTVTRRKCRSRARSPGVSGDSCEAAVRMKGGRLSSHDVRDIFVRRERDNCCRTLLRRRTASPCLRAKSLETVSSDAPGSIKVEMEMFVETKHHFDTLSGSVVASEAIGCCDPCAGKSCRAICQVTSPIK